MTTALYILLAILIFALLIFVHEGGHFAAAKLLGVRVNEFALGMGPAIWKKQHGETLYAIRCLPIGGFCAMEGEDETTGDPRAFTAKAPWRRIIILAAGAFMNFLLGLVVLLVIFAVLYAGKGSAIVTPVIDSFQENCPLEGEDGLQAGDRLVKIDGHRILVYSDVGTYLSENTTGVFDLTVRRDGKTVRLKNFSMEKRTYVINGVEQELYGMNFRAVSATPLRVCGLAWGEACDFVRMVWTGLGQLISGQNSVNDLSGPVGIVSVIEETGTQSETTSDAVLNIAYLAAFIAVNLAVMNMLPIPALDGGRVFLLLVTVVLEAITRKKIDPKYEGYIHAAGMVLLLAFMAWITLHDILKLFG